jgi:group I intron endonuclease
MKGICGVYSVTSEDGRQYVGSSRDIHKRWREHRCALRNRTNKNRPLQDAWDECKSFVFEILIVCQSQHLLLYEQSAIDALRPSFNLYQYAGSPLGSRHTEETKTKISALQSGEKSRWFGLSGEKSPTSRPTISATTGMLFVSGKAASDWLRENGYPAATQGKISEVCLGKRKSAYGHVWQFE